MTPRSPRWLVLVPAWIALMTAATHAAQVTTYTSRSTYVAALTSSTTISFNGLAPLNSFVGYDTPAGLTLSGVNFTGTNKVYPSYYQLDVVDPGYAPGFAWGAGAGLFPGVGAGASAYNQIHAVLPVGINAVGMDLVASQYYLFAGGPDDLTVDVNFADGTMGSFPVHTASSPTRVFLGLISSTNISALTVRSNLYGGYSFPGIFDFTFGDVPTPTSTVPEPSTLALVLLGGLAGVIVRARRTR